MKITAIVLPSVLPSNQLLAFAGVEFTCTTTGGKNDGFDIQAKNPGPKSQACTATCTVKKKHGTAISWTYKRTVSGTTPDRRISFGGAAGVAGAPLRDPKISKVSYSVN